MIAMIAIGCDHIPERINPSGTFEAVEIDLASTIPGRLLEVRPQLGDYVNAGDTVLIIDTELIALKKKQAEANHNSLIAQRQVTRDGIALARRNLEFLETTLGRTQQLIDQGITTQQQLDDLTAKRDIAIRQVESALHQLDVLSAEEVKLKAALAVFDRQLQEGIVTAPISGTVLLRAVEPGEIIQATAVAIRIADLSRLELRIFLGADDLDRVMIGGKVPVMVDALENDTLQGTVMWISSEAEFTPKNAQTRDARTQLVYAVKVTIDNPDGRLHIGMPAEVKL